ncbi:MAG: peptidase S8 [Myxococcales bacterium]|nr:peptidase S8 [Myxococcales bacterium]
MKKNKGLWIFLVCLLIGLGVGWWITRDRPDGKAVDQVALVSDDPPFFVDEDSAAPTGELVVDFADDVDPAYVASLGARLGIQFQPEGDYSDPERVLVAKVDPENEEESLAALRGDPQVEAADENFVYAIPEAAMPDLPVRDPSAARGPDTFPNDPRYGEQWHLDQIHMPDTWRAAQGDGVIVAVIDTGVTKTQDLQQTAFVPGWNFVNNSANTDDDHGHGTHVAGTIAQSTHNGVGVAGVAYHAKIMPMKVLSARGSGSVAGIAEAIRWASDHGAKVINMSLGGGMSSSVLAKAVKYAHDHGTTVVCAAGNDGRGKVSFPAANPGAIAVAATQKDETTTFYSNWGKEIDVAAPGGNTRTDPSGGVLQNTLYQGKDDYYFFMGTSMASPHAAGVAALIVSQGVTDPDAVEKVMKETSRAPRGMGDKPGDYAQHYGSGILDAQAAVKKAQLGYGGLEFGAAAGLAALLLLRLRRKNLLGSFGFFGFGGGLGALVIAGGGLFFLPQLDLAVPGMALLSHGIPAWDANLFGAASHGNLFFYSALLPVIAGALLYGFPRARGLIAGLALGVAGHLFAQAYLGTVDIKWMPFDHAWLIGNGLLATAIGYVAARK